mgnify:FL=1
MWFDGISEKFWSIMISMLGGLAKYAQVYIETEKFSWRIFIAQLVLSGFSGILFLSMAEGLGLSQNMKGVFAGVGGYMGGDAVKFIFFKLKILLGTHLTEKESDEDGEKES